MKDRQRKKLWKKYWFNLRLVGENYKSFSQTRFKFIKLEDNKPKYKAINKMKDKLSKNNNNK